MDKPQARQAFGGFRGAALNQSRSASGVYTGLICYGGVTLYESAFHVAGEKGGTSASAEYVIQDIFRFLAH
ncbi:hypothetical protein C3399_26475 [Enterobacter cloacae complex sp. ECNIH14]|nr:hypothetical protein C3399_26475 [Enterobacter cloacae complex sp. ECNIH14]